MSEKNTPKTQSVCKHCGKAKNSFAHLPIKGQSQFDHHDFEPVSEPASTLKELDPELYERAANHVVKLHEPASTGEPKDAVSDQYGFGTTPERGVCPHCGADRSGPSAEAHSDDCPEVFLRPNQTPPCLKDLERRPRMGSAVIIRDESGRVLVGQRCKDPFRGYWVIPGGGIWPNETINAAAIREIKEETGLDIEITGKLGIFEDINDTFHIIIAMSFGRIIGGELKSGDDCGELRWVGQDEFSTLETTPINKQVFALLATPAITAWTDGWVSVPHDLLMELRGVVVGEWSCAPMESDKAKYLHTLWTQIDAIRFPAAPGSVPQAEPPK